MWQSSCSFRAPIAERGGGCYLIGPPNGRPAVPWRIGRVYPRPSQVETDSDRLQGTVQVDRAVVSFNYSYTNFAV